jgi:guanylate kinase
VLIGPGGAGKGTVAERLVARDPRLWLSRSWTTRPRRAGEPADAYVFVDRATFEARARGGGFLEWAEFLGNLYGTPVPDVGPDRDVLLEIDVQGARQVLAGRPDALVVMLVPPSRTVQRERLLARGDSEEHVRHRLEVGEEEARSGAKLAGGNVVVNDDVDEAVSQVAAIVDRARTAREQDRAAKPGRHEPR